MKHPFENWRLIVVGLILILIGSTLMMIARLLEAT